jgi:hypothetical protein
VENVLRVVEWVKQFGVARGPQAKREALSEWAVRA